MKRIKSLLAVLLILLLALTACGGGDAQPTPVPGDGEEETIAPDFTINLLDGTEFTLSDHRGEVVILNFWATWCPPCVGEMPELQKLAENYADRGVYVLAVNCSEQEEKVQDFVDAQGFTLNIGLDPKMEVQMKYPTNGIPYTIFVDPEGAVAYAQLGVHPEDNYGHLTAKLDEVLAHVEGK